MKSLKLVVIALAAMFLLMIGRGETAAAPPPAPESEIVTAPGYQSQMPCTQPEMMQMMNQGSGSTNGPGTVSAGGADHAAHHPGAGSGTSLQSGAGPDMLSQLNTAIEQASRAIQAIGNTPQPLSATQKGVMLKWTDHLRVVQ